MRGSKVHPARGRPRSVGMRPHSIASLLVGAFVALSGALAAEPIPAADLREDAGVLVEALEALHPGLYRYTTREQFAQRVAELNATLSRDMTTGEAYVAFSQFLAQVRCGHAYCNFFNQPKEIARTLFTDIDRVPFHFRWIDGRMIVTEDRTGEGRLTPGTEIESINGVACGEILSRLLTIARADGSSDGKRVKYLEVHAKDRYEAFDIFLPLFFPQMKGPFTLALRDTGTRTTIVAPALTFEQRLAPLKDSLEALEGDRPVWEWRPLDERTTLLRMPGWALYNSKWDWRAWLNARMDELIAKGTPNLVIDLRNNEGGLDCGDVIAARLIERDLSIPSAERFVRYIATPERLNSFLDTWDDSFRDWGKDATPAPTPPLVAQGGQSFYRLARDDEEGGVRVLRAQGPRYTGRVFVIVDASCSSATFAFAQLVKRERLATLVGQTTGGNQRGINGGAFFFLRLPKTKIEADIPLIATFGEPDAPDGGIEPDVPVRPTVEAIRAGVDEELRAVRALIDQGR